MSLTLDIGDDYEIFDNSQPVRLVRAADGEQVFIDDALNSPFTAAQVAASGGVYSLTDIQWSFPAVQAGSPPEVDDLIYDDENNQVWKVYMVAQVAFATRYQASCKRFDAS